MYGNIITQWGSLSWMCCSTVSIPKMFVYNFFIWKLFQTRNWKSNAKWLSALRKVVDSRWFQDVFSSVAHRCPSDSILFGILVTQNGRTKSIQSSQYRSSTPISTWPTWPDCRDWEGDCHACSAETFSRSHSHHSQYATHQPSNRHVQTSGIHRNTSKHSRSVHFAVEETYTNN